MKLMDPMPALLAVAYRLTSILLPEKSQLGNIVIDFALLL